MSGRGSDAGDGESTSPTDFRLDWPSSDDPSRSAPDADLRLAWADAEEQADVAGPAPDVAPEPDVEGPAPRPAGRPEPLSSDAPLVRLRTRGSSPGIVTGEDHAACREEISRLEAEIEALRAEIRELRASAPSGRRAGRLRARP